MASDNDINLEHLKRELTSTNQHLVYAKQENEKLQGIIITSKEHIDFLYKDKEESLKYTAECERKINQLENMESISRKKLQEITAKFEEEQSKTVQVFSTNQLIDVM